MQTDKFFDALALMPNKRSAQFDDLAVSEWSQGFKFEGHAAVFDEVADLGEFTESVERGAFRRVLTKGVNVPMLVDHNPGKFLVSTSSGNLRLREDETGLKVEADVPGTDEARNLRVLADSGEIRGMSYGFVCGRGNSTIAGKGKDKPHRSIKNFERLLDVSPTWNPAYRGTDAQFRSLAMKYADSAESLQQLLMGAYPQLEERAVALDDTNEEPDPPEDLDPEASSDESGAEEQRAHLAAAKRRLQFMSITLKGGDTL